MTNAVRLEWLRAFATLMLFIVIMALAAIALTAAMERNAVTVSDSCLPVPTHLVTPPQRVCGRNH